MPSLRQKHILFFFSFYLICRKSIRQNSLSSFESNKQIYDVSDSFPGIEIDFKSDRQNHSSTIDFEKHSRLTLHEI